MKTPFVSCTKRWPFLVATEQDFCTLQSIYCIYIAQLQQHQQTFAGACSYSLCQDFTAFAILLFSVAPPRTPSRDAIGPLYDWAQHADAGNSPATIRRQIIPPQKRETMRGVRVEFPVRKAITIHTTHHLSSSLSKILCSMYRYNSSVIDCGYGANQGKRLHPFNDGILRHYQFSFYENGFFLCFYFTWRK